MSSEINYLPGLNLQLVEQHMKGREGGDEGRKEEGKGGEGRKGGRGEIVREGGGGGGGERGREGGGEESEGG